MCIIIYSPKSKKKKAKDRIPLDHIKHSLDNNPDGWGFMWAPGDDTVQVERGMEAKDCFHCWESIRTANMPIVFHARIGTHGTKGIDNCHPFTVPNHGELAMCHNGIIGECHQPMRKSNLNADASDTRNFVDEILAYLPLNFQTLVVYHRLLREFIGHSKLVFMRGDGRVDIVNAKKGSWHGRLWYSNSSFRELTPCAQPTTVYYGGVNAGAPYLCQSVDAVGRTVGRTYWQQTREDRERRREDDAVEKLLQKADARHLTVVRAQVASQQPATAASKRDAIVQEYTGKGWSRSTAEIIADGILEKAANDPKEAAYVERVYTPEPIRVVGPDGYLTCYSSR